MKEVDLAYLLLPIILTVVVVLGYVYMAIIFDSQILLSVNVRQFHVYFLVKDFLEELGIHELAIFTFLWNFFCAQLLTLLSFALKEEGDVLETIALLSLAFAIAYGVHLKYAVNVQLHLHYYLEVGAFSLVLLSSKSLKYYVLAIIFLALASFLEFYTAQGFLSL